MRKSGVDLTLAPWQFEALFCTAASIRDFELAVEFGSLLYIPSRLSPRPSCTIHTESDFLTLNAAGKVVGYHVPSTIPDCYCKRCKELSKTRARNDGDPDTDYTDYMGEYWQPKSHAGGRHIPVIQERGKEILTLYEQHIIDKPNMTGQTYRNRLTRLEELCEEVDLNINGQACRATCANYWAMWGLQPREIRRLMGWKYISTAQYYIAKSDVGLRWKMEKALGLQPTVPYEVHREPPTFLEIREALNDDEMLYDVTLTPESQQTWNTSDDLDEDPLEEIAQADLENADLTEFGAGLDPLSRPVKKRIEHEIAEIKDSPKDHIGFDRQRTATAGALGLVGSTIMGLIFRLDGTYADIMAGDPGSIASLLIAFAIMSPYAIWDMNEQVYEDPHSLEPNTLVDKGLLKVHAAVDSLVNAVDDHGRRWCPKRRNILEIYH